MGETTVAETISYINELKSPGTRTMNLYSMRASFNLPVRNVTPLQHHRSENSYGLIKDFLNIFRDGT
ncbi:MAG: hypothetical protein K6U03_09020, partial [Firmicutes bacterium]|nr:hypothetical protein [Bacillota bacterium]